MAHNRGDDNGRFLNCEGRTDANPRPHAERKVGKAIDRLPGSPRNRFGSNVVGFTHKAR